MCGRYRRTTSEEELARLYKIPIPPQLDLPISYNIAPTQDVLMIRYNPKTKQRSLDALRWGLIPYWTTDPKIAHKTINARAETVDSAPSYREAFRKRRCLIPADGFYEWRIIGGTKIPSAIGMKDDRPFAFAGAMAVTKGARSQTVTDANIAGTYSGTIYPEYVQNVPNTYPPLAASVTLNSDGSVASIYVQDFLETFDPVALAILQFSPYQDSQGNIASEYLYLRYFEPPYGDTQYFWVNLGSPQYDFSTQIWSRTMWLE